MEMITLEVYLPAARKSFDVRMPASLNCAVCCALTAKALSEMSDGEYLVSRSGFLAWRDTGKLLDANLSLGAQNVRNGSRLLLI